MPVDQSDLGNRSVETPFSGDSRLYHLDKTNQQHNKEFQGHGGGLWASSRDHRCHSLLAITSPVMVTDNCSHSNITPGHGNSQARKREGRPWSTHTPFWIKSHPWAPRSLPLKSSRTTKVTHLSVGQTWSRDVRLLRLAKPNLNLSLELNTTLSQFFK